MSVSLGQSLVSLSGCIMHLDPANSMSKVSTTTINDIGPLRPLYGVPGSVVMNDSTTFRPDNLGVMTFVGNSASWGAGTIASLVLSGNMPLSIEMFIKPVLALPSSTQFVMLIGTSSNGSMQVRYETDGTIFFNRFGGGNNTYYPLEQNAWQHIVYTYDTFTNRVYKNGSLVYSLAADNNYQVDTVDFSLARKQGGTPTDSNAFAGSFGVIRVYAKTLTASEVLGNFNANRARYGL
jgi:hypothetical protein